MYDKLSNYHRAIGSKPIYIFALIFKYCLEGGVMKCHDHLNKLNNLYVRLNLLIRELQEFEKKMKSTLDHIALDSELLHEEKEKNPKRSKK